MQSTRDASSRQYHLGRRIVVRGVTGSGKSTFARDLGEALGLKVIDMDAIHWQRPDWQPLHVEEFRAQLEATLEAAPDGWVCEGNYSAVADVVLSRADTLIWLDLPFRVSFYRMVKRTFARAWRREVLWGVQRESLWMQFFSKNSLIWWGIHHHRASKEHTRVIYDGMSHVQRHKLQSARDVEGLLAAARAGSRRNAES